MIRLGSSRRAYAVEPCYSTIKDSTFAGSVGTGRPDPAALNDGMRVAIPNQSGFFFGIGTVVLTPVGTGVCRYSNPGQDRGRHLPIPNTETALCRRNKTFTFLQYFEDLLCVLSF